NHQKVLSHRCSGRAGEDRQVAAGMARYDIPPTKSSLFSVKEQLSIAREGFELLEQKREILIMELMRLVEEVKLLERDLDRRVASAFGVLKHMLVSVGRENARDASA